MEEMNVDIKMVNTTSIKINEVDIQNITKLAINRDVDNLGTTIVTLEFRISNENITIN